MEGKIVVQNCPTCNEELRLGYNNEKDEFTSFCKKCKQEFHFDAPVKVVANQAGDVSILRIGPIFGE